MNNALSTFIAFAGFLVVFSVLVTSVQETIKNLLKLKTGVWENFFSELYKKEFLGEKKKNNKIDFIPNYWSRPFIGEFDERLKRLKRIIVLADASIRELQTNINNLNMKNLTRHSLEKILETTQQVKMLNLDSLLKIFDQFGRLDLKKLKEKISAFEESVSDYLEVKDDKMETIERAINDHGENLKTVTDTNLPLGWSDDFKNFKTIGRSMALVWFIIPKIGGLLLTSFLITFGAPFWRDMLNALVGLKNTGLKNPSKG